MEEVERVEDSMEEGERVENDQEKKVILKTYVSSALHSNKV